MVRPMTHSSEYISDVSSDQFATAVIQRSHEHPIVVDFWAEWCGPCKTLGPLLERLTVEHDGDFELVKIDVDANPALSQQFGIQGIPTVIGFRDGVPAARFTGALPEPQVREFLAALLPTELDRMVDSARDAALTGNLTEAEHIFRQVLEQQSDHPDAGTGLASLLLARQETEEALIVLGKLTPSPEVERLQAAARLGQSRGDDLGELERKLEAAPDDAEVRLEFAKALAARNEFEPALDHMLSVVRGGGPHREAAKTAMLDVFGILGTEHPLTITYRKQLTSALF